MQRKDDKLLLPLMIGSLVGIIAVAVIVEGAGSTTNEATGGDRSAPIAKAVMEAYLASQGGS